MMSSEAMSVSTTTGCAAGCGTAGAAHELSRTGIADAASKMAPARPSLDLAPHRPDMMPRIHASIMKARPVCARASTAILSQKSRSGGLKALPPIW
jgi:hypothetical protein